MVRAMTLAVLIATGALSMAAYQGRPARHVRDIQNVRDNLYFITGGDVYEVGQGRPTWTGGNVAVFVTQTGVVLVDSMLAGSGAGLLAQVRKVTDKPVTTIIHTIHTHTHSQKAAGKSVDEVANAYRIPARYNGYYADPGRVKPNVHAIFDNK